LQENVFAYIQKLGQKAFKFVKQKDKNHFRSKMTKTICS